MLHTGCTLKYHHNTWLRLIRGLLLILKKIYLLVSKMFLKSVRWNLMEQMFIKIWRCQTNSPKMFS